MDVLLTNLSGVLFVFCSQLRLFWISFETIHLLIGTTHAQRVARIIIRIKQRNNFETVRGLDKIKDYDDAKVVNHSIIKMP